MTQRRRVPLVSTPKEHGALVCLIGAGVLALALAPRPGIAFGAFTVFLLAHLARGPVERRVRKFRARPWDAAAFTGYTLAAAGAAWAVARIDQNMAVVALACGGALLLGGALAQSLRVQRSLVVELAGMGLSGVAAGVAIRAGGGSPKLAMLAGAALASYATSSVLLVRAQLRKLPPAAALGRSRLAAVLLVAGIIVVDLVQPLAALAFAPRLAHAGVRCVWIARPTSPYTVAAIETIQLVVFIVLLSMLAT